MAEYTKNLNLKKPAPEDFVDIADLNGNFDVIDEKIAEAAEGAKQYYGTCTTAAATAAKVVTADRDFVLETGAAIDVKFSYANSASAPTLNVGDTGAKAVKKYGNTAPNTYQWYAGAIVRFVYDGTYWIIEGGTTATTTYYGVTKLNSSTSSTSTTEAATPSAVKAAMDKANAALPQDGGTMTGKLTNNNAIEISSSSTRGAIIIPTTQDTLSGIEIKTLQPGPNLKTELHVKLHQNKIELESQISDGSISQNGVEIKGVANPKDNLDAVNKQYMLTYPYPGNKFFKVNERTVWLNNSRIIRSDYSTSSVSLNCNIVMTQCIVIPSSYNSPRQSGIELKSGDRIQIFTNFTKPTFTSPFYRYGVLGSVHININNTTIIPAYATVYEQGTETILVVEGIIRDNIIAEYIGYAQ